MFGYLYNQIVFYNLHSGPMLFRSFMSKYIHMWGFPNMCDFWIVESVSENELDHQYSVSVDGAAAY
jgi:hypothetical protein